MGAALAVLGSLFAPPSTVQHSESAPHQVMPLAVGEKAYWSGTARSPRWVFVLVIAIAVTVAVLYAVLGVPWPLTVALVLILACCASTLVWRVVVDERGVTTTGILGLPRFHIPLARVTGASALDVVALRDFGGWGIRYGRSGAWGVVVRSGSAIEVERAGKASFVITVDDAATGAALLNGLAQRR